MLVLAGLLLIAVLGVTVVHLLKPDFSFVEKVAAGYGIGASFTTFILFCLSWAGLPLSLLISVPTVILAASGIYWVHCRRTSLPSHECRVGRFVPSRRKIGRIEVALGMTVFFFLLAVLLRALYWPVRAFDAFQLYDHLARLFFSCRSIALGEYYQDLFSYYLSYPIHVPLMYCWVYLLAGNTDINPKFVYAFYYISFVLVFYCRTRSRLGRKYALLFTLVLASIPKMYSSPGWTSTTYPLMYYYCMGAIYLCEAVWRDDRRLLVLGALFISFMAWVRPATELLFLSVLVAVSISSYSKWKLLAPIVLFTCFGIIYASWAVYVNFLDTPPPLTMRDLAGYQELLRTEWVVLVLKNWLLQYTLLWVGEAGIVWYSFLAFFLYDLLSQRKYMLMFWIVVLGLGSLFLVYCLLGLKAGFSETWENTLAGSGRRLMIIFLPLLVYYMALVFSGRERSSEKGFVN